eukprot:2121971-Prymnesium_polylepis.1
MQHYSAEGRKFAFVTFDRELTCGWYRGDVVFSVKLGAPTDTHAKFGVALGREHGNAKKAVNPRKPPHYQLTMQKIRLVVEEADGGDGSTAVGAQAICTRLRPPIPVRSPQPCFEHPPIPLYYLPSTWADDLLR